jgi:coenzyme PQQ precursor peptide PqqA
MIRSEPPADVRGERARGNPMAWKTPKIVEIAVGMEINCYACAELAE